MNAVSRKPLLLQLCLVFHFQHPAEINFVRKNLAVMTLLAWGFLVPGLEAATSMVAARQNHAATLLPNGKVLVVGGNTAGAELFDPGSGTWIAVPTMSVARANHTCTLVQNGKVLVVGGYSAAGPVPTAETYDALSGTWAPAAQPATARGKHTATLLPNGKVLVVGGSDPMGAAHSSAELYDLLTGSWSYTGSLNTGRYSHTATLLSNGKVLVTGGTADGATGIDSAETYDPTSGLWSREAPMQVSRFEHTATLLDGRVLIAGGTSGNGNWLQSSEVFQILNGGWISTGSMPGVITNHTATLMPNSLVLAAGLGLQSAFLYNPLDGTWAIATNLLASRLAHTATLLPNGRVMVSGGASSAGGASLSSSEVYTPATGTWSLTSAQVTGGWSAATSAGFEFDGSSILLTNGQVLTSTGWIYDPADNRWFQTGPMNAGRRSPRFVLLPNGKVLAIGGLQPGSATALASAEIYDPATANWTSTGSMNYSRRGHSATLLRNGKVLVAGGYTGSYPSGAYVAVAELFDPTTGIWTTGSSMSLARGSHTATLLTNGKVLIAGGTRFLSGGYTEVINADLYDPATGGWTVTGSLANRRSSHTAVLLPNGKVMVAGGHYYQSGTLYRNSTEIYNPSTGTWAASGNLNSARSFHAAVLMPNGKTIVMGGNSSAGALASAELFDPIVGSWKLTGTLADSRYYHTASLLLNGRVFVAGGTADNGMTYRSSVELYEPEPGIEPAWRPEITAMDLELPTGENILIGGQRFRGISEASSGNASSSPTSHPILQLMNLENGQFAIVPCSNWSGTNFTSSALSGAPAGWTMASLIVNGIASRAVTTRVQGKATVALGNLVQTYNGTGRIVSVTTVPPGLPVTVAYDGLTSAPTNVGTYQVVATVDHPNYVGQTTSMLQIVRQLSAGPATYSRAKDLSLRISIADLLTNVSCLPADAPMLYLAGVGASGQGATVSTNQEFILYQPANNAFDTLPYTVTDGSPARATGYITVHVLNAAGPVLPSTSIQINDSTATVKAFGIPGYGYVLETAFEPAGPWWPIQTNYPDPMNGVLIFVDANATNSQQYYRTTQP